MDDTGWFPIRYCSGNQHLMIAYQCDYNAILAAPFKSRKDSYQLLAYNLILTCLKIWDQLVDLQILYHESSA